MSEKKQKAKPVPHNRGDRSKSFEILDRIGTGHLRERNCSMFSSLHETQNYSLHRNFLPICLNPNSYHNRFSSPERQQKGCLGWIGRTRKGAVGDLDGRTFKKSISVCFAKCLPCNTSLTQSKERRPVNHCRCFKDVLKIMSQDNL